MGEATRREVSPMGAPRMITRKGIGPVALGVLLVTGCQSQELLTPSPEPEPSVTLEGASVDQPTTPPEFIPGGSAEQNRPYVTWLLQQVGAGSSDLAGADAVAALEAGGLVRADMEVTADRTAIGLEADSISLSVRIAGECLIAQWSDEWIETHVAPILSSGTCLLGETVSLD